MTVKDVQDIEARARSIRDQHGARGTIIIAEKLGAVTAAEDRAGITKWRAIASAFVNLHSQQAQRDVARHMRQLLETVL